MFKIINKVSNYVFTTCFVRLFNVLSGFSVHCKVFSVYVSI